MKEPHGYTVTTLYTFRLMKKSCHMKHTGLCTSGWIRYKNEALKFHLNIIWLRFINVQKLCILVSQGLVLSLSCEGNLDKEFWDDFEWLSYLLYDWMCWWISKIIHHEAFHYVKDDCTKEKPITMHSFTSALLFFKISFAIYSLLFGYD